MWICTVGVAVLACAVLGLALRSRAIHQRQRIADRARVAAEAAAVQMKIRADLERQKEVDQARLDAKEKELREQIDATTAAADQYARGMMAKAAEMTEPLYEELQRIRDSASSEKRPEIDARLAAMRKQLDEWKAPGEERTRSTTQPAQHP